MIFQTWLIYLAGETSAVVVMMLFADNAASWKWCFFRQGGCVWLGQFGVQPAGDGDGPHSDQHTYTSAVERLRACDQGCGGRLHLCCPQW